MKEVIIIIFHFIFLLAVRGNTYQCPDCLIPCVANSTLNITNSQLLQTFHHQIRDYTLLTFLDAINGDVRFMSSHGSEVFSKTISVNDHTMSELCSIFSNPPKLLRTSPHPKIKFMFLRPYLLSDIDESGNFYLFERMSLLLREQRDINVQLRGVKSGVDVLNYTMRDNEESFRTDVSLELRGVESKCNDLYQNSQTDIDVLNYTILDSVESVRSDVSLGLRGVESKCNDQYQNSQTDIDVLNYTMRDSVESFRSDVETNVNVLLERTQMRKNLEYAILDAHVYGTSLVCHPSNYHFQLAMAAKTSRFCYVTYPNWMHIKLLQEFEFNVIQLYLWDGDSRVYTYSVDISRNGMSWTSIIVNQIGQGLVTHRFDETYTARYLRMQGSSTVSRHLHLYWLKLGLI